MYNYLTEITMSILAESEEKAVEVWNKNRLFNESSFENSEVKYSIGGCYTYFQGGFFSLSEERKYYFSFQAMPLWTFDLVDEFNNLFTNIKIIPVKALPIYLEKTLTSWGNTRTSLSLEKSSNSDELVQILFTIELSPEYNKNTFIYLYYILHHLMRMISLGEKRVNFTKPYGSLLEHIFKISLLDKYRSLCEFKLTIEDFKKLDDIGMVNFYLNYTQFLTQTEIFMNLLWDRYCRFPKGSTALINNAYYNKTNSRIILEKINKYSYAIGYTESGKIISTLRISLLPDKLVPTDSGKFKKGDFVTTKVNHGGIPRGVVIELYENMFMDIKNLSNGDKFLTNQNFYKRIPKTQYAYYGIEG